MEVVKIHNEGPIRDAQFRFPNHGALIYLRGENGSGKSHALTAIGELLNKTVPSELEVTRGETKGFVEGFGVRLTLTEDTRRKGELSVHRIEGLDPSDVIDPGIDDEVRADTARIKSLARLVMAGSDVPGFAALVGGVEVLNQYAQPESLAAPGVVDQAQLLKRDFDRKAVELGKAVTAKRGQAAGLLQTVAADMEIAKQPTPSKDELERAAEQAIQALGQLEGRKQEAERARQADSGARAALDALRAQDPIDEAQAVAAHEDLLRDVEKAFEAAGRAGADVEAAKRAVVAAERRQREADAGLALLQRVSREAAQRVEAARKRKADIAAAEQAVKDAGVSPVEPPTDAELQAAREARDAARVKRDRGVSIRDARVRVGVAEEQAAKLSAEADALAQREEDLRGWARDVWTVVAAALKPILPEGLSIKDGRLIFTDAKGQDFFGKKSEGERTDIIVRATAEAAHRHEAALAAAENRPPRRPVIVFPQRWGESLQPKRQRELSALARDLDVWIVTAECDDGPLRSEVVGEAVNQ